MSQPVIRLHDVVRDFGAVRALDHLSFEVMPGTVFGFLGPNGAGKTTAIRVLLGLVRPTSGRVEVFGLDPTRDGEAVRSRAGADEGRRSAGRALSVPCLAIMRLACRFIGALMGVASARTLLGWGRSAWPASEEEQGRRDSNPQPPVLETGALPIELLP